MSKSHAKVTKLAPTCRGATKRRRAATLPCPEPCKIPRDAPREAAGISISAPIFEEHGTPRVQQQLNKSSIPFIIILHGRTAFLKCSLHYFRVTPYAISTSISSHGEYKRRHFCHGDWSWYGSLDHLLPCSLSLTWASPRLRWPADSSRVAEGKCTQAVTPLNWQESLLGRHIKIERNLRHIFTFTNRPASLAPFSNKTKA